MSASDDKTKSDPGRNADGSVLVKASKQGGALPSQPFADVLDAATLQEMENAAHAALTELTPEEAQSFANARGIPYGRASQVCVVLCEYTAGDTKVETDDPDSALAQKWLEKGLRVFVQVRKPDGTVIGMRTMMAGAAIEAMRAARSGRMVSL